MNKRGIKATAFGSSNIFWLLSMLLIGGFFGFIISAFALQPALASEGGDEKLGASMNRVWVEHMVWTRQFIIAFFSDSPDADYALKRLLKNQEDIGKVFAEFYGEQAGAKITALLKEHISIAGEMLVALKAGDDAKFNEADARWVKNAEEFADYMSQLSPYFDKATVLDMMRMHLEQTKKEVAARLGKNWENDGQAFDSIISYSLEMSEYFYSGIVRQFPEKFKG